MGGERDEPRALANAKSWRSACEYSPLLEAIGGSVLAERLMSEGIFAVDVWLKLCLWGTRESGAAAKVWISRGDLRQHRSENGMQRNMPYNILRTKHSVIKVLDV